MMDIQEHPALSTPGNRRLPRGRCRLIGGLSVVTSECTSFAPVWFPAGLSVGPPSATPRPSEVARLTMWARSSDLHRRSR